MGARRPEDEHGARLPRRVPRREGVGGLFADPHRMGTLGTCGGPADGQRSSRSRPRAACRAGRSRSCRRRRGASRVSGPIVRGPTPQVTTSAFDPATRVHVWVFALHIAEDPDHYDPLDIDQWTFRRYATPRTSRRRPDKCEVVLLRGARHQASPVRGTRRCCCGSQTSKRLPRRLIEAIVCGRVAAAAI